MKRYKLKKSWRAVLEVLYSIENEQSVASSAANVSGQSKSATPAQCRLDFELCRNLVFHLDCATAQRRWCIPKSVEKEVF